MMSELSGVVNLFKSSTFYEKYKDTYFSDKILRDALKCEVSILHPCYGLKKKSYEEVHELSASVLRDLFEGFALESNFQDKELFWDMIFASYIDPDENGVRELKEIKCTADGLFSIQRIYRKYGIDIRTVEEYETYRKVPVFFFPQEKPDINTTRTFAFGDKIDHTLYDLKMYLDAKTNEEKNKCKLISAYNQPKTKAWLEKLGSFKNLVEWFGIQGIFVDDNYDVYDIEKGQGEVISGYLSGYNMTWSDKYYDNLKNYVDQYMSK